MRRRKGEATAEIVVERPKGIFIPDTVKVPISRLNAAPYNPRKISAEMLDSLKSNILYRGFIVQLVVQRHSEAHGPMVILGGHQRLRAVREICIENNFPVPDLPCVILDVDDRAAKLINIALNKIDGEFDRRLLVEVLEGLEETKPLDTYEVHLIGFEPAEYRAIVYPDPPRIDPDDTSTFGTSVTLSLEFMDVRVRDAVKAALVKRAKDEGKTTGEVVCELLGRKRR